MWPASSPSCRCAIVCRRWWRLTRPAWSRPANDRPAHRINSGLGLDGAPDDLAAGRGQVVALFLAQVRHDRQTASALGVLSMLFAARWPGLAVEDLDEHGAGLLAQVHADLAAAARAPRRAPRVRLLWQSVQQGVGHQFGDE